MKIKYLMWAALFLLAVGVVAAQQPTMLSLQGRVLDSSGALINNGNLRVTVSTSDSCEQNIIYDYAYNNLIQNGIFTALLGNNTFLNLTYNQDYYVCTYVNGEIQRNAAGGNRTKFRGGQGQIQPSNVTNGTFANGNYTFRDNLTAGAGVYVKSDEDFFYRVTRAAIRFKDFLDRSANENVTGNWTFSGSVNATNFVGNGSGLTGITANAVDSADVEWELLYWNNYSTTAHINLSGLVGENFSNVYKVEFMLFGLRNTTPIVNPLRTIDIRINNFSTGNYFTREISATGFTTRYYLSQINLFTWKEPSSAGNTMALVEPQFYGSLLFFVNDPINSTVFITNTNPFFYGLGFGDGDSGNSTTFLSALANISHKPFETINIVTTKSGDLGITDKEALINGSVKVYRHKDFTIY